MPAELLESATDGAVDRVLARGRCDTPGEVAALLSRRASGRLEEMALLSRRLTVSRFGRVMQLYVPLYLSSECVNLCHYCGFSVANRIRRRTLGSEEVLKEWGHLRAQGFRHVLLVSGEDRRFVSIPYLREIVAALRPGAALISIEIEPLEEAEYRTLAADGTDSVVVYQETYDRARYAEVHPKGPKRDFDWRREAPARAARAGIRRLGMGVLLGLSDWRSDVLDLVLHVRALQKRHWRTHFSVSLPRLRPAAGGYEPPVRVSDADLVQIVAALRVSLPTADVVLSTREPAALRDRLVPLGITQMSAGSRTEPGGYTLDASEAEPQFAISDERTPAEVAERLSALGYEPVWKDWEADLGRSSG